MLADMHMTGQTDVRKTRRTDGHQFQKQPNQGGVLQYRFQIGRWKHLQVRVRKALKGWMHACPKWANGWTPISKATEPWWCPVTPLSFKIDQTKHLRVSLEIKIFRMSAHTKRANRGTPISKQPSPGSVLSPYKFKTNRQKHLQVRVWKLNFKMAAMITILFCQKAPTLKAT